MSISEQRVNALVSNVVDLSALLNVKGERTFLQQFMSPEAFQECVQGGDTNMDRVKILCDKIIQEITAGNSKTYDALCEYLLRKYTSYQTMYQRLTTIGSTSDDGGTSSRDPSEEQPNEVATSSSERHVQNQQLFDKDSLSRPVNVLPFTFEDMIPLKATANGSYEAYNWQEKWLNRWDEILKSEIIWCVKLPLPQLMLNASCIAIADDDEVAVTIIGHRWKNDFLITGAFHNDVPERVPNVNLQLELSLTFTKKDNTKLTEGKEIIVTAEHVEADTCMPIFFTLYEFPFASLSSTLAPAATKIVIKGVLPNQKWCWQGMEPLTMSGDRNINIDCKYLHGADKCAMEWKRMVSETAYWWPYRLSLPPLILPPNIVRDAAVCVCGARYEENLQFNAKFHPSTNKNETSLAMTVKMSLTAITVQNCALTLHAKNTITDSLRHEFTNLLSFPAIPWSSLSPFTPPVISLSIVPVGENTAS